VRITGEGSASNRRELSSDLNLTSFVDILSMLLFFLVFNMAANELAQIQMKMGSDKAAPTAVPETVKEVVAEVKILVTPNVVELWERGNVKKLSYTAEADFDWAPVDEFLKRVRTNYPTKKDIIVQSRDAVSYGMVVKALDYSLGNEFKEPIVMGVE
jgi:biopolymer transport protein ExbD